MALTAEMNMMIAQSAGFSIGEKASAAIKLAPEHLNQFKSLGLGRSALKEQYSELDISKWKSNNLDFKTDWDKLPAALFRKTPSPDLLSYVQKRKKTIDDLVKAIEFAQKTSKPEDLPALLQGFMNLCEDARSEALKNNTKGLANAECVHLTELSSAAAKAVKDDEDLSQKLSKNPKAYMNDPSMLAATLEVLKKRQAAFTNLESSYNANAVKHGTPGHMVDFFREEWLPLTLTAGLYCRNVNALDAKGLPIVEKAMSDGLRLSGVHLNKETGKWMHKYTVGLNEITDVVPEGTEVIIKKRLAAHQTMRNMARRATNTGTWLKNVPWSNVKNLDSWKAVAAKVPGKWKGIALGVAALAWAGTEAYCYTARNPNWSKPIKDAYTKMTDGYTLPGGLGYVADWVVPDVGKAVGMPLWTSESLNHVQLEFKDI